jgi:hypothetical protein
MGQHRLYHPRIARRRGVVVEVDDVAVHIEFGFYPYLAIDTVLDSVLVAEYSVISDQ